MLGLDGHGDEVQAAGAGILHIDQRIANAADDAAADGGKHPIPFIDRQKGQHKVGKKGEQQHTAQAAQEKVLAQSLIADQNDGDVQNKIGHADGQAEQMV